MIRQYLPRWFLRALGTPGTAALQRFRSIVDDVRSVQPEISGVPDDELRAWAATAGQGSVVDDRRSLVRVLAAAREVCSRALGIEPYDEQLLGCAAMIHGYVIEMDTGEGKTIVGALAAAAHSLSGRRVHVLSVNDYLAERDANWMGPIYELLGIRVAWVGQRTSKTCRKLSYAADVVYAPVSEVGYDVLRDGFAHSVSEQVGPTFDVGIVDEADAVMIDEAISPLVLAGEGDNIDADFYSATSLVELLQPGEHFVVDADRSAVSLTELGTDLLEDHFGGVNLYDTENIDLLTRINLALHARALIHRDVDYLVENGALRLINTSRGRISHMHRWPDGLHAAIEAKEGLTVTAPGIVLDSLTIQDLLLRYDLLVGMSGTVLAVADELQEFYSTASGRIEPHKERIRVDEPIRVFFTNADKEDDILDEITKRHARGQPVLVGTQSVAESEHLATELCAEGVFAQVLNARNSAEEAEIVSHAGQYGSVTISTQMSGRGTDIKLGGPDESDRDRVVALGGLAVISTSLYPSRRLDAQLLGRAGRQGDPGVSLRFVSLTDELIDAHVPGFMRRKLQHRGRKITSRELVDIVNSSQKIAEALRLERHRSTWHYNRAIAIQRQAVITNRLDLLHGADQMATRVRRTIPDHAENLITKLDWPGYKALVRTISLHIIDDAWTSHLAFLNDVREGINLRVLAGQDPVQEFHLIALREFDDFFDRLDQSVCELVASFDVDARADVIDQLGLRRPSATWTYMVPDNPLGTPDDRAARNVQRIARQIFKRD
ncbi:accessory Sec system translocase SecA2 [Enteractinococcus helveticum]|uniref:accessory Sec system translocase SecA2 n=1 Tax=Enteractinococcus helveticum TaxID=1837282 RepID=UPI0005BAE505|nr:accessory Sec system translocase SecA2 [Enteractinococcus helveticum]